MGATLMLTFATIWTAASLILVALSFATDHWIDFNVDRDAMVAQGKVTSNNFNNNPLYFTRYRGLFRTCYPGNETLCKYIMSCYFLP